jgi:hypothetical protein
MLLHEPQAAFAAPTISLHRVVLLAMLRNFPTQEMHQVRRDIHQEGQVVDALLQPLQVCSPCTTS